MPLPSRETLLRYGLTEAEVDALFAEPPPPAGPATVPDPMASPRLIHDGPEPSPPLSDPPGLLAPRRPWVPITARVPDPAAAARRSGGNPIR